MKIASVTTPHELPKREYGPGSAMRIFEDAIAPEHVRRGMTRCPAHPDEKASLSVAQGDDRVLVHCQAGCAFDEVVMALGLTKGDLFDEPLKKGQAEPAVKSARIVAAYDYTDANGKLLYQSLRYEPKDFKQRRPANVNDGWAWDTDGVQRVPYKLPDLLAAIEVGEPVWIVEGEKDVHALNRLGEIATCNSGGAQHWAPELGRYFTPSTVVNIVVDIDKSGGDWLADVLASLDHVPTRNIKVWQSATGGDKHDLSDHLAAGYTLEQLVPRVPAEGTETSVPRRRLVLQPATDIPMRATRWLWKTKDGRPLVPMGEMTLIQGFEGVSKSTVVLDLAASVTRGALPGDLSGQPHSILILATEDSFGKTIAPRLLAAGADMTRVYNLLVEEVNGDWGVMELRRDCEDLADLIRAHDIAVVVLDPLISRLGKADTHKDSEVRQQLEPLVRMADETGAAVLGLIHYNKSTGGDRRNKTMGSRAFTAVTRAVFDVTEDVADPSVKLISLSKANLSSRDVPSFRYRMERVVVGFDAALGKPIEAPHIIWEGEDARSIEDLLEQAKDSGESRSKLDEATMWLEDVLTFEGPLPSKEVKKRAKADGIAETTLERAADVLNVVKEPYAEPNRPRLTRWSLPRNQPNASSINRDGIEAIEAITPGTVQWLQSPQSLHNIETGRRGDCTVCGLPVDPTLFGDTHPSCDTRQATA